MQSVQSSIAAPTEIQQVASNYKMGIIRALHGAAPINYLPGIIVLGLGLWMAIGSSSLPNNGTNVACLIFGITFCVFGFLGFFGKRGVDRNIKIYVCEHGFIYAHTNEAAQPFRWDQITAVWRGVTHVTTRNQYGGKVSEETKIAYTVERKDGYKVSLSSAGIANMTKLSQVISEQTTRILLPLAVQSYNQGQTAVFGTFSVNKQGLKRGQELIPWQQIEAIDTQNGMLRIKRQGTWKVYQSCAQIPNLFVFLSLTDSILKTQAQR